MVSANTLCKNVLNVKDTVIENFNLYSDEDGVKHIRIKARPDKWHDAYSEYKQVKKDNPCGKGRPKKDEQRKPRANSSVGYGKPATAEYLLSKNYIRRSGVTRRIS